MINTTQLNNCIERCRFEGDFNKMNWMHLPRGTDNQIHPDKRVDLITWSYSNFNGIEPLLLKLSMDK